MWEPFTERARRSIVLAQEEAQRLGNNYIGTEHILLGIISEGESLAAKVLETLGVNLAKVRAEVEAVLREGESLTQFIEEAVVSAAAWRRVQSELVNRGEAAMASSWAQSGGTVQWRRYPWRGGPHARGAEATTNRF